MPCIKVSLNNIEEVQARQLAARQGISIASVLRRGLNHLILSAGAHVDDREAVVDQLERRNGQGKRITAAYLSPPLANAVRKIAAETSASQSHVVRDLIRSELRRRGALPTPDSGSAPHDDDTAPWSGHVA